MFYLFCAGASLTFILWLNKILSCSIIMFVDLLMTYVQNLYKSFQEEPGFFQFATTITSNDLEEIQKFLDDAVNSR